MKYILSIASKELSSLSTFSAANDKEAIRKAISHVPSKKFQMKFLTWYIMTNTEKVLTRLGH